MYVLKQKKIRSLEVGAQKKKKKSEPEGAPSSFYRSGRKFLRFRMICFYVSVRRRDGGVQGNVRYPTNSLTHAFHDCSSATEFALTLTTAVRFFFFHTLIREIKANSMARGNTHSHTHTESN